MRKRIGYWEACTEVISRFVSVFVGRVTGELPYFGGYWWTFGSLVFFFVGECFVERKGKDDILED